MQMIIKAGCGSPGLKPQHSGGGKKGSRLLGHPRLQAYLQDIINYNKNNDKQIKYTGNR